MQVRDMLNKPLLSLDTAERVGWVEDVLIDTTRQCVSGLLVKRGTFSSQIVLPFRETHTVGADAVIVRTAATLVNAREWVDDGGATYRARDLYGKEVVTGDGTRLGFVHDALVEQYDGRVYALEVSAQPRGAHPRTFLVHTAHTARVTGDVIVVTESVAATATNPVRGH
jgi:sporulation protein YlmC with PRC-barrel domain